MFITIVPGMGDNTAVIVIYDALYSQEVFFI